MENNILNWFTKNFHNGIDENGSHIVTSNNSCLMKDLKQELIEARRKDIINVLKILNDNYPISDGGPSWLETEEDFNHTADEIINFEKQYKENNVAEKKDDNVPCENWYGPNHKNWACKIFCINSNDCDGITCKKDCDWYNGTGYFKVPNSVKKTKK